MLGFKRDRELQMNFWGFEICTFWGGGGLKFAQLAMDEYVQQVHVFWGFAIKINCVVYGYGENCGVFC